MWNTGDIPVLMTQGVCLAEAYEKSLVKLWAEGYEIKTEYDKPGDPPSKDCTITIVVNNPLAEPMIHREFPGGIEDLQEYTMEVLDGIKDHCVRKTSDSSDKRWEYTYHQRLFGYTVPGIEEPHDQIEMIAQKIAKTPYTRRAQAITWKVWEDNDCSDPACLQSIWCRALPDESGVWRLNMNIRIRSNDAFKAGFMNMFAFIMLQKKIAEMISKISGRRVLLARYCHHADSYHLYGYYIREFQERFLRSLKTRTFEERTYRYDQMKPIMDEVIPETLKKASEMGRS